MEHLDRLISDESIEIIEESRKVPRLNKTIDISQIKSFELGSLSFLKPMIEANRDSVIKMSEIEPAAGFNEFQLELLSLLKNYKDLLYTNESIDNQHDIQEVYVRHVLDHLISSRSRIISNNKVFERKTLSDNIINDDPMLRDQGYTRARILFLLPFRYSALKLGKCIIKLLGEGYNVNHLDRFFQKLP